MTSFFVPNAIDGKTEDLYAWLAGFAGRPVPPVGERIRRIAFVHDGETWVAEVGQLLRGTKTQMRTRRGQRRQVTTSLSDPATVLAIFAGVPFMVVTNARIDAAVRSQWENPFLAGQPDSVEYFAA